MNKLLERTVSFPKGLVICGSVMLEMRVTEWFCGVFIERDCDLVFVKDGTIHMRGLYWQLGFVGGHVLVKSDKCYEQKEVKE